ncbi:hypothetical protein AgCh_013412 [Apium graveolens]
MEGGTVSRRWEDLDTDVLLKIIESFNKFELAPGIAHVCRAWRWACSDPLLWQTVDLSHMQSNFIKTSLEPYVYVDNQSDRTLTRILRLSLSLSHGHILTLVFHYNLYLTDEQLSYTAERCPRLKRLVMPAWNRIKRTGICKAMSTWKDLESMTMPSIGTPRFVMEEIFKNCKNFAELKIMGSFNVTCANSIVQFLPNLKVLSLRCSMVIKEALVIILDGLEHLEVLNISHCHIVEVPPPPAQKRIILKEIDDSLLQKASRLRQFFTCMNESCIMCQRSKADEGLMRWYRYEENAWKADEVQSLAL